MGKLGERTIRKAVRVGSVNGTFLGLHKPVAIKKVTVDVKYSLSSQTSFIAPIK